MDLEKSPTVAVVLFITSEHLDYHRSVAEYVRAKSNLVRFQREDDLAVLNGDNETAKSFQELTRGRVVFFSRNRKTNGGYVESGRIFYRGEVVGETKDLQLRGEHNWDNVTAAVTVTREIGVETTVIKRAMVGFKGLEHRLERVRKVGGVTFYNDSFSTTPETTMAAIRAFREPIILIAGGSDKGSDYREMAKEIGRGSVRVLILIGRMAEKIREAVEKEGFAGEVIFRPDSMREAVMLASRRAREGEVVILSPACASFDMFENYKERGKEFKKSVEAL
jgi:UDP-N-acetylmuramoylalanine--D-glutamate ligase